MICYTPTTKSVATLSADQPRYLLDLPTGPLPGRLGKTGRLFIDDIGGGWATTGLVGMDTKIQPSAITAWLAIMAHLDAPWPRAVDRLNLLTGSEYRPDDIHGWLVDGAPNAESVRAMASEIVRHIDAEILRAMRPDWLMLILTAQGGGKHAPY